MHTAATPAITGTDHAATCEVSPVSVESRTSKAAPTAAASTIRHVRSESGRPAGRPEDRRGNQPVSGREPEVRLVGPRGGDDEGQQQVQRAGSRDADEAEQADEADAAHALRGDRLTRGLGAGVRHAAAGAHVGSSLATIVGSSQTDGPAGKRSWFDPLRAIHYLRFRTPTAVLARGRRRTRVAS